MKEKVNQIKNSVWGKLILIGVIAIFLSILGIKIDILNTSRSYYSSNAKNKIFSKWGSEQTFGILSVSVPITKKINSNGDIESSHVYILPSQLSIKADTENTVRYRGIYKVPLHETSTTISGAFKNYSDEIKRKYSGKDTTIEWSKATVAIGINDFRGMQDVDFLWEGEKIDSSTSASPINLTESAILANVDLSRKEEHSFTVKMKLRGSGMVSFYPLGEQTSVELNSNWKSPSFDGAYLPKDRTINSNGFSAKWKVHGMTNSLPRYWDNSSILELAKSSKFGVNMHMPLQNYQLNTRSTKYMLLFIVLTFMTMFFSENIFKLCFHSIHYLMTGAGLVVFFLLLLSFSEHINFNVSYFMASLATILTISLYVLGVSKNKKTFLTIFSQLSLLYSFLFVVLKQEDYALISGALLVWLALAVAMFVTRKIDWNKTYSIG